VPLSTLDADASGKPLSERPSMVDLLCLGSATAPAAMAVTKPTRARPASAGSTRERTRSRTLARSGVRSLVGGSRLMVGSSIPQHSGRNESGGQKRK